jgi:uncharacterized BrkB/YihY/UPF0761 family membrane protein
MNIINHKHKMNLFKGNRKGSSYWFMYTLAFLFVLGVLYIIFNQTLQVYLYPTTQMLTHGDTTQPDRWLGFWRFTPLIMIVIALLFMFFKLTQRDTTGE